MYGENLKLRRKLFYTTNIREAFRTLAHTPEVTPLGLCKLPLILARFG